jgi:O-antigen ligase
MSLSAWIGWPGSGPAPGHDWLPGSKLRFVILGLTYTFLALALTVNYAYGTAFFLLALIGMYVGFRRGFVNGLTRIEKLVFLAFAAYPVVAIASYLLGTQTNIGFRFLGRDLRFLLFIPVYLAIRWARPNVRHLGWAFAGGAVADLIMALLQHQPWPAPTPHGVTGTHITFGDLSILSGFLAAALLLPLGSRISQGKILHRLVYWIGAAVGLLAGVGAGLLAGARGGWLAIPVLLLLFLWLPPISSRFRRSHRLAFSVGGLLLLAAAAWLIPTIHHRINLARQNLTAYLTVANARSINAPCVDRKDFLRTLMRYSRIRGPGHVAILRLPKKDRKQVEPFGCKGNYGLFLSNSSEGSKPLQLSIYRGNGPARSHHQQAVILARGEGSFTVWWRGPWVKIHDNQSWYLYRAIQSYDRIGSVNVHVPSDMHLWLIPIQIPHGVFAYALAKSSVGQRLEMWRAAWVLFIEHPWLGVGTGAFYSLGEDALGASAMAPIVGEHQHAHSNYLTSLGTKGVAGFLAVVILLFIPFVVLTRKQFQTHWDTQALTGAVITVGMGVFALTETMFIHSLVNSWYAVATAVLVAAAMVEELLHD